MRGLSAVTGRSELSRCCLMRLTFGSMPHAQRSVNERMASASSCADSSKLKAGAARVAMALAGGVTRDGCGPTMLLTSLGAQSRARIEYGRTVMAKKQADTVYKIVEVVGVSEKSWEDAGRTAVETAAGTLRDLRVADGHEGRRRQSRRLSHPCVAVLQIRGLRRNRRGLRASMTSGGNPPHGNPARIASRLMVGSGLPLSD